MDICFEGIGQMVATFATKEDLASGMAVTLAGNGEVSLGKKDDPLCGITVGAARGGAVAVQIGGVAKVGYADGATVNLGRQELACDGKGKVNADGGDGVSCLVLAVDKDEKTVVVRL